ncbi:MAG TPA: hypothetical protein VKB68_07885 [Stellaceae bacterium]|nr:hypothetical protein [Stellaceae bacterium]
MKRFESRSVAGAAVLALGVLTATAPLASAGHDVYPPGWNMPPNPNLPKPMFDFRSGWGWDDYQRYWPDQVTHGASPASRPIPDAPAVYGMTPTGHRYHWMTQ